VELSEKKERLVELFRKMYGYQYIPRYDGSPYDEHPLDDAELVLHELAHQTLMPDGLCFAPGYMRDAVEVVGYHIEALANWQRDLNEIKALAIEFVVSKRLGLGLDQYIIARNSVKNTECFGSESDFGRFVLAIRQAKRTLGVQCRADTIIEGLNLFEKGLL
jgi:hypothetical protein